MKKLILLLFLICSIAVAEEASDKPNGKFYKDAILNGGDGAIKTTQVTNIRRAKIEGGERTVIDLKTVLGKVPYYSVDINSVEKKVVVSVNVSGSQTQYDKSLNQEHIKKAFQKSNYFTSPIIYPAIDNDFAILEFPMKKQMTVSVFHLNNPGRIILDTK